MTPERCCDIRHGLLTFLVATCLKNSGPMAVVRRSVCSAFTNGRCRADCRFLCSMRRDTFCSCTARTCSGVCTAACSPAMPVSASYCHVLLEGCSCMATVNTQDTAVSKPLCTSYRIANQKRWLLYHFLYKGGQLPAPRLKIV